jgi:segregation and condensation protein A
VALRSGAPAPTGEGSLFAPREGFLLVDIERFQGPLDLLLHLIRTQDIDVFDIPIARITDQFLGAVKEISAAELDNAGEFLEMAATLVRIKAQMLLPRHGDEEEQDPRAELVRRLLEYEQIREIAQRLERAETEWSRRFPRGWVPPRPRPPLSETPLESTWEEVMEAAMQVELPREVDRGHRVTLRAVAMEDKVELIVETLREVARVEFSRLLAGLDGVEGRMHGVMTLLATLELTRRRDLYMRQVSPFSELWLYRRDEESEAPPGGAGLSDPGVAIHEPQPSESESEETT